jgi:hypothetical protein
MFLTHYQYQSRNFAVEILEPATKLFVMISLTRKNSLPVAYSEVGVLMASYPFVAKASTMDGMMQRIVCAQKMSQAWLALDDRDLSFVETLVVC